MTALSEAFDRAGIRSTESRLEEIALQAMVANAGDMDATMQSIWQRVQKDRDLMAVLFQHAWRREVGALIHRVRINVAYKAKTAAIARPVERKAAKVVAAWQAEEDEEERQNQLAQAEYQAQKDREYQAYLAQWRATQIGRLAIDDTPIWQCTPATVRAWLQTEKRRWRTVELLIEGLPEDGRPIEFYRRPEEVAELFARAGVEATA